MELVQFRVDADLKEQATSVYESLGIDLSTALRMFMKRSVKEKGIPFSLTLDNSSSDSRKAIESLEKMQRISLENDNSEMTLDDINEEIRLARLKRDQIR